MGFLSLVAFTVAIVILLSKCRPMFSRFMCDHSPKEHQNQVPPSLLGDEQVKSRKATNSDEEHPSDSDDQSTPKVRPAQVDTDIPTFAIDGENDAQKSAPQNNISRPNGSIVRTTPPQLSLPDQPQRSAKPSRAESSSGLMLPPGRPGTVSNRSAAASLRVPSTGPLPNRGPPVNSQQRVSTIPRMNGAIPTSNARGKVLLSPGHSPMDWAVLTRTSRLSGVDTFRRVAPSELRQMTGRKGKPAWSSWQNKVYNITPYLPFHPGGEAELMKAAGRDGTKLFMDVHPWVNWENMLESCLVGIMVPEDYGKGEGSSLEDMD